MLTQLQCPNGHQWRPTNGPSTCPVCGAGALAIAETATLPLADDAATLPPSPKPAVSDIAAEAPLFLVNHPRYRVLQLLGRGGMGAVYMAEHLIMDRIVALKVIGESLTGNPEAVRRFQREVRAVARLSHRSIVTAYDAEQVGDAHFLVMEYVPGKSFARIVAENGPLPVMTACEWIGQAAEGLHHAHSHGHVHRDIKPQNLIVTPEGQVKILDFGLARLASERHAADAPIAASLQPEAKSGQSLAAVLTQAGSVMGTPDYIAPEQAGDSRVADIRSDIYSLGCTFYFLLTGNTLFSGGSVLDKLIAHREQKPKPITAHRSDIPPAVVQIIDKMLSKRPEDRYATPGEVVRALEPWRIPTATSADATGGVATAVPDVLDTEPITISPPTKTSAPKRRSWFFLGCIAVILATLLGCAGVATWLVEFTSKKVKEVAGIFQDRSSKDELWSAIDETWEAPVDDSPIDELFPHSVSSLGRTQHDSEASIAHLQLELTGRRAIYRQGNKQVDVIAGRLPEEERDRAFDAAKDTIDNYKQGVRMSSSASGRDSRRLIYVIGPWKGVLWWKDGWLFAAHSRDDDDPERLLMTLLRSTISRPTKDKTPSKSRPPTRNTSPKKSRGATSVR